jgi:hypothetical protein
MKTLFKKGKRGNLAVCIKDGHSILDEKTIIDAMYVLTPCGHYVYEKANYCPKCGMRVKEYLLSVFN